MSSVNLLGLLGGRLLAREGSGAWLAARLDGERIVFGPLGSGEALAPRGTRLSLSDGSLDLVEHRETPDHEWNQRVGSIPLPGATTFTREGQPELTASDPTAPLAVKGEAFEGWTFENPSRLLGLAPAPDDPRVSDAVSIWGRANLWPGSALAWVGANRHVLTQGPAPPPRSLLQRLLRRRGPAPPPPRVELTTCAALVRYVRA